jgi:plastocyanin
MRDKALLVVTAVGLLSGEAPTSTGGTVSGKVDLSDEDGTVLKMKEKDTWVYLESVPARHHGPVDAKAKSTIKQKGKQFVPNVVVAPTGVTVEFPNYDENEEHNVFSPSMYGFDLQAWAGSANPKDRHPRQFLEPDEYDIYCDIHKNMWAVVKVVDSQVFAQVNEDGTFELHGVPDGDYKVVAWTPYNPEVKSKQITIASGNAVKLGSTLHVHPTMVPRPGHKRMDGTEYPL